jgi:hypothetical protein
MAITDLSRRDRVRAWSPVRVNERIDHETQARVRRFVGRDRSEILRRIEMLDREWDIDRAVMALHATMSSFARERGIRGSRVWRTLARVNDWFLVSYAVAGWAPPIAVLRRLGCRTCHEIDVEKQALESILEGRHGAQVEESTVEKRERLAG